MRKELVDEALSLLSVDLASLSESELREEFVYLLQRSMLMYKQKLVAFPQLVQVPGLEGGYLLTAQIKVE